MKDLQITENNMRIKRGNVLIAIISIIIDMIRYVWNAKVTMK